jgi:hypothetical protein
VLCAFPERPSPIPATWWLEVGWRLGHRATFLVVEVIEGIELLKQSSERLGSELPLTFDAAGEVAIGEALDVVPLSPELLRAYRYGAPSGQFPSFVQLSLLYEVDELRARQVGHAVSASGEAFPEWDTSWVVIGAEDGDPFIAHVDRPGTPVSVAKHGTGIWNPVPIADSLGTFYALIAAWSSLLIEDFDGSMLDEDRDFELKDGFWQALDLKLSPILAQHEITALRGYLAT